MLVEKREDFKKLLKFLLEELDITETQFKQAVTSYNAVGDVLARNEQLNSYKPTIKPQGSFLLGTMIKPLRDDDELDVDLVCQLTGKQTTWTQKSLKEIIGDVLRSNGTYGRMLQPEGKRCWTLKYADESRFHMDILPSLIGEGYEELLNEVFDPQSSLSTHLLGIRITDNTLNPSYYTDTNPDLWPLSNPFGYAAWFYQRGKTLLTEKREPMAMVEPFPQYSTDKTILQTIVQILKRHRDLNFGSDENKPISIIITTLAAKAYNKETDLIKALGHVVSKLAQHLERRYDYQLGKEVYWVENPINSAENFADKWVDNPELENTFFEWIGLLKRDLAFLSANQYPTIMESNRLLSSVFGSNTVSKAIASYGEQSRKSREDGNLRMKMGTGTLGIIGRTGVRRHNYYGLDA